MKRPRQKHTPTDYVAYYRQESLRVLERIREAELADLIALLHGAREARKHVFVCGNGGSAATASHMVAGLGNEGSSGREQKFRVLSLTDNIPWLTSLANDHDYSAIFVE